MTFQRGDVILVPSPFSDLSAAKVRPAGVVSSDLYHSTEPDLLLAALTSQVAKVTGPLDYLICDWREAGLLYEPDWEQPPPVSPQERAYLAQKLTADQLLSETIIADREDRV